MELEVLSLVLSVAVVGVGAQWIAWRTGLPAIVVLLVAGLLLGPIGGALDPSLDFGAGFRTVTGLVVGIIVFEGGLNLNLRDLRAAGTGVLRLILAVPLVWLFGALAGRYVGGLSWEVATLFGAIMVVTGPTVILPLLRQNKLKRRPAAFLKWEGIVNDPIGALLSILILEFLILAGHRGDEAGAAAEIGVGLAAGAAVAVALGIGWPFVVRWLFRQDLAPEYLKTPILLASVLAIYAAPNAIQEEAGLIGATLFGLTLANIGIAGIGELKRFKGALTVLLVSALFILLTADLHPEAFARLSWPIASLTLVMLFVARPAAILLATIRSGMSWGERALVAWIAPRGIVAAAVAGIAGDRLTEAGYADAELIVPTVFAMIAATVVLHGFTIGPLARRLDLTTGDRPGLLIVGSSPWTVDLAQTLAAANVPVVVADASWTALAPARRAELPTIYGELTSERAEENLDFGSVDYVLAATDDDAYNALVSARFAVEMGRERVHQIGFRSFALDETHAPSREWRGKVVGGEDLDYAAVDAMHAHEWRFAARPATEDEKGALCGAETADEKPLVVVRKDGTLAFCSPESETALHAGDLIVSLTRRANGSNADGGEAARHS